jgi:enamine deaminase RidA (YjgF/YER057c/UK114 family)
MKYRIWMLAAAVLAATGCAPKPAEVVLAPIVRRHTGDFPIATAVEVPPGYTLVFHSGTTPSPAKPDAPAGTPEYWGDTRAQSLSVLTRIKDSLTNLGLTFGDVVSMTVYLAADKSKATKDAPARMDFDGFMESYRMFFGDAAGQPNLPSRSTVEVANLVSPGMLVEIEVTLAKPATAPTR